jgi:hypothetical protein
MASEGGIVLFTALGACLYICLIMEHIILDKERNLRLKTLSKVLSFRFEPKNSERNGVYLCLIR